jgi:hypothetical protein
LDLRPSCLGGSPIWWVTFPIRKFVTRPNPWYFYQCATAGADGRRLRRPVGQAVPAALRAPRGFSHHASGPDRISTARCRARRGCRGSFALGMLPYQKKIPTRCGQPTNPTGWTPVRSLTVSPQNGYAHQKNPGKNRGSGVGRGLGLGGQTRVFEPVPVMGRLVGSGCWNRRPDEGRQFMLAPRWQPLRLTERPERPPDVAGRCRRR